MSAMHAKFILGVDVGNLKLKLMRLKCPQNLMKTTQHIAFKLNGAFVRTAVKINCLYKGIFTFGFETSDSSKHLFRIGL